MEKEPQPQDQVQVLIDMLHHDNPSWQQTVALQRIGLSNSELSWMLDSDIELHTDANSARLLELCRLASEALRIIQDVDGVRAWFRAPIYEENEQSPIELFSIAPNDRFMTPLTVKSALLGVTPYLLDGDEQRVAHDLMVWADIEVTPRSAKVIAFPLNPQD